MLKPYSEQEVLRRQILKLECQRQAGFTEADVAQIQKDWQEADDALRAAMPERFKRAVPIYPVRPVEK